MKLSTRTGCKCVSVGQLDDLSMFPGGHPSHLCSLTVLYRLRFHEDAFFLGRRLSHHSASVQSSRPAFLIQLLGQVLVARPDVGLEVHAARELSVAALGRARIVAHVPAKVARRL